MKILVSPLIFAWLVSAAAFGLAAENSDLDPFDETVRYWHSIPPSRCHDGSSGRLIDLYSKVETLNQSLQSGNHDTLLHLAIQKSCVRATEWLLDNGADWKIRNKEHLNAFDLAVKLGHPEILQAFLTKFSGGPIESANGKARVSLVPAETAHQTEMTVKLGFSISNISDRQLINLNSAFKGMYRLDSKTVLNGRTEVFFSKVDSKITSIRYIVEGKVTREDFFAQDWDGAINLKNEGFLHINTVDLAALVEKSWLLFDETVKLSSSAGPGIRYIIAHGNQTRVEPIVEVKEGLKWTPKKDFWILKGGRYTFSEDWTFTGGDSGYSSLFEVSGKHKITDQVNFGLTYKHWKTALMDTSIDDNQILFELTYDSTH